MKAKPAQLPPGHVLLPGLAIGSLAIVLAAGLGALGLLDRADAWISSAMPALKSAGVKSLPLWAPWAATAVLSLGLSLAMLAVPCMWRRFMLWLAAIIVTAGWIPVLLLASHKPVVAAPLVAVFWSGVCALIYARNHRMPVDAANPATKNP